MIPRLLAVSLTLSPGCRLWTLESAGRTFCATRNQDHHGNSAVHGSRSHAHTATGNACRHLQRWYRHVGSAYGRHTLERDGHRADYSPGYAGGKQDPEASTRTPPRGQHALALRSLGIRAGHARMLVTLPERKAEYGSSRSATGGDSKECVAAAIQYAASPSICNGRNARNGMPTGTPFAILITKSLLRLFLSCDRELTLVLQQGMPAGFDHIAKRQRIGDPQLPNYPPNLMMRAGDMGPPAAPAWAPPMPTAPILSGPKVGSLNPPPMFLAAGGMDYLVDMMQGQDVKQQKQAAQVVFEACTDNPSNQELLKQAGGVPQMVKLLKDGSTEVQSKMAAAIAAACADNRDNRNQALKANAMAPLIDLLDSKSSQAQENAANALANIIKKRMDSMADASGDAESDADGSRGTGSSGNESSTEEGRGDNVKSGQAELNRRGGLDKLLGLLQSGAPRVKEAAAAAIANAMADNKGNREAFQQAGGVAPMLGLLKTGDPMAQENATTALWNAMVDNEACKNDLIRQQGMPVLVQVLCTGTDAAQERAAGAIWKSCVNDPSIKEQVKQAIPGLVQLLRTGSPAAKVQAAGALRSACINSAPNKRELNRMNGISALVAANTG